MRFRMTCMTHACSHPPRYSSIPTSLVCSATLTVVTVLYFMSFAFYAAHTLKPPGLVEII